MNRMTSPPDFPISLSTALSRSSNSPRNFVPAMREPMSRASRRLFLSDCGTSPLAMRWARPSTTAVLPTPASPMRTGLFLVRRDRTWMTRRISSSRPMTGSSLPWRARAVRSRVYFSRTWYLPSGSGSVTRCEPRTAARALRTASSLTPFARRTREASFLPSLSMARKRCSVETYSSLSSSASLRAASRIWRRAGESVDSPPPLTLGRRPSAASMSARILAAGAPILARMALTMFSSWARKLASRCSGRISWWPISSAKPWAFWMASWDMTVN